MSAAVYRSPVAPFLPTAMARECLPLVSSASMPSNNWLASAQQNRACEPSTEINEVQDRPPQLGVWSMIFQPQKASDAPAPAPYVHPLARRLSSLMSEKSLEMCTENLGSETGSDGFSSFSSDDDDDMSYSSSSEMEEEEATQEKAAQREGEAGCGGGGVVGLGSVNYLCSVGRRSPPQSFPPPLRSMSQRDGPCLGLRSHRKDGRLVLEAVPVPSQNYLHASRQDGRLLLSFVDTTFHQHQTGSDTAEMPPQDQDHQEEGAEAAKATARDQVGKGPKQEEKLCYEEEEEVEVVDNEIIVEVKVGTQVQQQHTKVRRSSSLVTNKLVGGGTLNHKWTEPLPPPPHMPKQKDRDSNSHNSMATARAAPSPPLPHLVPTTTTATELVGRIPHPPDSKLLHTSKRRSRGEAVHHMGRCSQLRGPFFFRDPCRIATSS